MIFTNARLIFPMEFATGLTLSWNTEKSPRLSERSLAHRKHDVIDLSGNYLAPGFIDVHVHGALDRDTMEALAEALSALQFSCEWRHDIAYSLQLRPLSKQSSRS